MRLLRNLANVTFEEQKEFLNSFKHVLCDMDGVIWLFYRPLPGAASCINNFKKLGKDITFITNNAITNIQVIKSKLLDNRFTGDFEVINPAVAITAYLKKINFNKQIYTISSISFKETLTKAGFILAPDPPQMIEEQIPVILEHLKDDPNIGAVVGDFDLNLSRLKVQKVITYLKRKDCLFIVGGCDKTLPIGSDLGPLIGNEHFFKALTEISGREFMQIAKPSIHYLEYVREELNLNEPSSVLCIGDSIPDDMGFATKGGFQKLLVLTGNTKTSDIDDWKYPEEFKPQYYVENMSDLNDIIKKVFKI